MNNQRKPQLVAIAALSLVAYATLSCTSDSPATEVSLQNATQTPAEVISPTAMVTDTPTVTSTPTIYTTPTNTPTPTATRISYQPAFGIDYAQPELYLPQGEQTQLSDLSVLDSLRAEEKSLAHLGDIWRWLRSEFTSYKGGGKTIGAVTVDQLMAERQLSGCHDYGLVYAAVARELGYPTVMFHAVSIAWVAQFRSGEQGPRYGHVYVEIYLDGRWVLIDSTNGWYVEEGYDPANPVIPLKGPLDDENDGLFGYYVQHKGKDSWDSGIHSLADLNKAMAEFAQQLDLGSIEYPDYLIERFKR